MKYIPIFPFITDRIGAKCTGNVPFTDTLPTISLLAFLIPLVYKFSTLSQSWLTLTVR